MLNVLDYLKAVYDWQVEEACPGLVYILKTIDGGRAYETAFTNWLKHKIEEVMEGEHGKDEDRVV